MSCTHGFASTLSVFLVVLSNINLVSMTGADQDLDRHTKEDTAKHQSMITGLFLTILISCFLILLLVIIGLCCYFRNRKLSVDNTDSSPFTKSDESFLMSVKVPREKGCNVLVQPPVPKVRSQSCSDFIRDEPLRKSFRLPPKKPNINVIIGEEITHCSPFPVPEKMPRRYTTGSSVRSTAVKVATFNCPVKVSTNPFTRQMSLPISMRSDIRRMTSTQISHQSCPFT